MQSGGNHPTPEEFEDVNDNEDDLGGLQAQSSTSVLVLVVVLDLFRVSSCTRSAPCSPFSLYADFFDR